MCYGASGDVADICCVRSACLCDVGGSFPHVYLYSHDIRSLAMYNMASHSHVIEYIQQVEEKMQ